MICPKCGHDTLYKPVESHQTTPGKVKWVAPQMHPDIAERFGIALDADGRMVFPTPNKKD